MPPSGAFQPPQGMYRRWSAGPPLIPSSPFPETVLLTIVTWLGAV